jgi:F0F1-type ATP synthase beta subunit
VKKRVLEFQSQPFFVAEPWIAVPAAFVALDVALESYRAILRGDADTLSEQDLLCTGAIPKPGLAVARTV